jgi:septal ring factor EnvC (AmiA/AmiB activator)
VKNVYDYLISRYGHKDYQPNLYMMIEDLSDKIKVLEDKYSGALQDIKRLEEENIETTNTLYKIMNSVDAVDARIDILADYCRIVEDV